MRGYDGISNVLFFFLILILTEKVTRKVQNCVMFLLLIC